MNLNDRIKEVRIALGLSQSDFAARLGVTRGKITNIERGVTSPSHLFLDLLCSTYNISDVWLRTGEGDMFLPVSRREQLAIFVGRVMADDSMDFQRRFLEMLSALRPEQWELLREMVERLSAEHKKSEDV